MNSSIGIWGILPASTVLAFSLTAAVSFIIVTVAVRL
jgi:hypothetical protein